MKADKLTLAIIVSICVVLFHIIARGTSASLSSRAPQVAVMLDPDAFRAKVALALAVVPGQNPSPSDPQNGKPDQTAAAGSGATAAASSSNATQPSAPNNPPEAANPAVLNFRLEPQEQRNMARSILEREIVDHRALLASAYAAERIGSIEVARQLFAKARQTNIRDSISRIWLLQDNVKRNNFDSAIRLFDELYRMRVETRSSVIAALSALADNAQGRTVLINWLAKRPLWFPAFFSMYGRLSSNPELLKEILLELKQRNVEIPIDVAVAATKELGGRGRFEDAYFLWLQTLPPSALGSLPLLANGDFSKELSGFIFDWSLVRSPTATTEIVEPADDAGTKVLRASFFGERSDYRNVRQVLMLSAGNYNLTGQVRLHYLENPRGLVWRVYCLAERNTLAAQSRRFRGNVPKWVDFKLAIKIKPVDCVAQYLVLELAARNSPERLISGQAEFRAMRIERVEDP
jgi:hypothetical protein